jgi:hypothetical protein
VSDFQNGSWRRLGPNRTNPWLRFTGGGLSKWRTPPPLSFQTLIANCVSEVSNKHSAKLTSSCGGPELGQSQRCGHPRRRTGKANDMSGIRLTAFAYRLEDHRAWLGG